MTQPNLFDLHTPLPPHAQPKIDNTDKNVPDNAKPRLGGQNGKVLERLLRGPATNIELAEYSGSQRMNSRIADVRRWLQKNENKTIVSQAVDTSRGIYRYEIREAT